MAFPGAREPTFGERVPAHYQKPYGFFHHAGATAPGRVGRHQHLPWLCVATVTSSPPPPAPTHSSASILPRYTSSEEFAADALLVFDNCQTFNEDDSEVGKAGHIMRRFFESRWEEFYQGKQANL